jgi:hypothetical protein
MASDLSERIKLEADTSLLLDSVVGCLEAENAKLKEMLVEIKPSIRKVKHLSESFQTIFADDRQVRAEFGNFEKILTSILTAIDQAVAEGTTETEKK